jgi:hypothetical protein
MIGHLAVPNLNNGQNTSATLSKPIIQTLLRNQLGFDGLVISDALNMKSVSDLYNKKGQLEWEAFNAGNDVLCFAENIAEGIQEILNNATAERIEESYNRIVKCKQKVGLLNFESAVKSMSDCEFDFEKTSDLNYQIGKASITKIIDNSNTETVFNAKASNTLAKVSFYKKTGNLFFKALSKDLTSPEFSYQHEENQDLARLEKDLDAYETLLIALFVPKAKPLNNFDIDEEVLAFLKKMLDRKKCVLYVFGNPYALQVIPNLKLATGIIQVYQDFDEFQLVAANQLISNSNCEGTLPVSISNL